MLNKQAKSTLKERTRIAAEKAVGEIEARILARANKSMDKDLLYQMVENRRAMAARLGEIEQSRERAGELRNQRLAKGVEAVSALRAERQRLAAIKAASLAQRKADALAKKVAKLAYIERYGAPLVVQTFAKIRPLILDRDNYSCRICYNDAAESGLEVHHIDRSRLNNSAKNLITLCGVCHRGVHRSGYYPGGSESWDDGSAWGGVPEDISDRGLVATKPDEPVSKVFKRKP
jgi:5-methylcytosine-specific restriction endonuclease McrA